MISVLILTYNEEINISDCLASVAWSDDVLVLDSGSTDDTVALARQAGARVMHRPFDTFAAQRNYGLAHGNLQYAWVLHLDADERVPPALQRELVKKAERGAADAYRVPSKLIFQGRWLKHAGMYPTYQVRFGRRSHLRFAQVGHGQRGALGDEAIGTLQEPLLHYAFSKGITDWFARHNRYSSDEAAYMQELINNRSIDWSGLISDEPQRRRRALKDLSYELPLRPLLRFLYMYVGRRGFLDGWPGFHYCVLLAIYEYMIQLKARADAPRADA